jgi:outer membrane receptor protein involved in Fe transport
VRADPPDGRGSTAGSFLAGLRRALAATALLPGLLAAQATVVGRVLDARTGEAAAGASVRVEGVDRAVIVGADGRYILTRVPAGPQTLRAERIGYAPARVGVVVPGQGSVTQDILMAETALQLEGLVVTADAAGRARGELGTATVVAEEAIRAQTAVSLAGVLELLPGVQLNAPGLDGIAQIGLRSVPTVGASLAAGGIGAGDLASFGTLIVLDGVPMSNNANLQTLGQRGETQFATTAGGGIDLRRIPAAAIERVEVIRGVPSARYGDLTQGAIVVDTRTVVGDAELMTRYDPRSTEAAMVGGRSFAAGAQSMSLTFDAAQTRTQPGLTDDRTVRLAGQLAHRLEARDGDLTFDTRIDAFELRDDRPENANVRPERASWLRERGLRVSERARWAPWEASRLEFTGSYTRFDQRSWAEQPRVRGPQPFTDRLTEGRAIGRFVSGRYLSEVQLDGVPQLLYSRLEYGAERSGLGFNHDLRIGTELRREWNSGPGYQFDIAFPPQVTFNSVEGYDRPRRWDAIPALTTSGLYVDDRLRRSLGGQTSLEVQAGLRFDVLHEGEWWASGARDAMLQPRINAELSPVPWVRLRAGWGRTAKLPAMGQLSPPPQYHDVVNVNWFAPQPAERLAVLTTTIKETENPDLGFSRGTKSEIGIELLAAGAVLQVAAFDDRIDGAIGTRWHAETVLRDLYQLSDSTLGTGSPPTIIEPPFRTDTIPVLVGRPDHLLDQRSRGVELTAFLPEFAPLRTRLQVQGAWIRTRQQTDASYFGPRARFTNFQLTDLTSRTPYWIGSEDEGRRVLMTYRLIHHQPALGFVVTLGIQHNVSDERRDFTAGDSLAFAGYLTRSGELVPVAPERRGDAEFADLRLPRSGVVGQARATPSDWLMTLQASKSLPMDGRLNFWAFNVFDNDGIFRDNEVQPRFYPAMRFGMELSLPARALERLVR